VSESTMYPCPECGVEFDRPQSTARHRRHKHGVAGKDAAQNRAYRQAKKAAVVAAQQHSAASPATFELCMALLNAASPTRTVRIDDLPEIIDWMRVTHEVIAKVSSPR
jgi:uncharacterized C2H2 Zn-finger protein